MFAPRWTVWRLTRYIRHRLTSDEELTDLFVEGEVSELYTSAKGHLYFTLQDDQAKLKCVQWAGAKRSAGQGGYRPVKGHQVVVLGTLTVYEWGGNYQLNVKQITPLGEGEKALALAQLKERLTKEGLFDERHKKALPAFPRHIALVTSDRGAAITDLTKVLGRRWPLARLTLVPTLVQGEQARHDLAAAMRVADELAADLLIVGRGGGSPDDLWAFNTELVVRAIFEARTPVISAVGHESDITLADLVADLRAPTPSAAAELAVPEATEVADQLRALEQRLASLLRQRLTDREQTLEQLALRLDRAHPRQRLLLLKERLQTLQARLVTGGAAQVDRRRQRLGRLVAALEALSPLRVLGRGYGLVKDAQGRPVGLAASFAPGETLELTLQDGRLDCRVERVELEGKLNRKVGKLNKQRRPGSLEHGPATA